MYAVSAVAVLNLIALSCVNWDKEVNKALERMVLEEEVGRHHSFIASGVWPSAAAGSRLLPESQRALLAADTIVEQEDTDASRV